MRREALIAPALLALVALPGCWKANELTWSAESLSSDQGWIAQARTEHTNHGFGGESQWTTVEVKQNVARSQAVEVLRFDEGRDSIRDLKMSWPSPDHLDITYHGNSLIVFQAIKAFGKDITVEKLP